NTARHLRELWELLPPNPEEDDRLFETALRGRALEQAAEGAEGVAAGTFREAKGKAETDKLAELAVAKPAAAPAEPAPAKDAGAVASGRMMRRQVNLMEDRAAPATALEPETLKKETLADEARTKLGAMGGAVAAK